MGEIIKAILRKKIHKSALIVFALFYLIISSLKPIPALAEGNPFVPTTDTLNTGLSAQIGADELNTASQNIANFTDIAGAYYDSTLNRIVFIGTTGGSGPKFNQDDVAVAVKAIFYNNSTPSLSIDDDSNNPSSSTAIVTYTGGIQNTNLANVLFNADYKLKQYVIGYNPNQQKVTSNVSTYKSVVGRYLALNPTPVPGNESKFAISPQSVTVKTATSASAFVFTNVTMQATTQAVNPNNDALWNQAAQNFANDITANYDQYGQETTYFAQTKQLAKIVAVLKWVTDYGISTDSLVARNYTPQFVSTPSTIQKVSTPAGYFAQGAINYNAPNSYLPDDGTAFNLKTSAQSGSSSKEDVTWTFTSGGQQYTAVAVAAGAFKSLGAYNTSVTDFSISIAGDLPLAFKRTYSSFSNGQYGIGQGWDMVPARLYPNAQPQALDFTLCNNIVYYTKLATDTTKGHETFTYNCPSGYTPDDPSSHSIVVQNSDGSANITSSDQTKYQFNPNLQLTSILDKNGNAINYSYDGSGKLTSIADTKIHQLIIAYNGQNLISSVTDWSGRRVQYAYDSSGRLIVVTDPNNNTTIYTYDSNGKLTTITDRTGQVVLTNTYGGDARIATSKNSANLLTTYTYDNVNKIITQTDSNGRITKTSYDDKARILQQTDPAGKNIAYTYSTETVPLTYTDRNGNKEAFTYDSKGNITSVTFPDNSTINYTYNGDNRLTKILDGRYGNPAKQTDFIYDANGNLTQKTEAGVVTKYTYDSTGKMLTTTDPLNNTTTYTRDSLGNILTEKDPYVNTTTYAYDSLGRQTKLTDPNNIIISYTYDANGNLIIKTDGAGTTINTYDKENRLTKVTAPNNTTTQYTYNVAGSITSVIDALNNTTTYGYNSYQNLTSQQDALNHTTINAFDNLSRQISTTTPLGKATNWQFDSNGNITQRTDANGKITKYQYDSLNRLTKITYPDNSTITYQYDSRGNLTSMTDPNGTSTYVYDFLDRMAKATNPYSQSLQYAYDNLDNLTQLTYPDGKLVKYTYDKDNRMLTVADWNNKVITYTYNNNGVLATRVYPNGITTYYTYDSVDRLSTLEHKKDTTSNAKFALTRNSVGNVTIATQSGNFISTPQTNPYTYDNLGRLTGTTLFDPSSDTFTYTYDKVGNILTLNSFFNNHLAYTYDADNKLTIVSTPNQGSFNQEYDNNGNLITRVTNGSSVNLTYNSDNRLKQYGSDTYTYDGLGNRLFTSSPNMRYITDVTSSLPRVLEDYDLIFNKGRNWYVYGLGGAPIEMYRNTGGSSFTTQYYIEDGFGNERFLTDTSGNKTTSDNYDPYGNLI